MRRVRPELVRRLGLVALAFVVVVGAVVGLAAVRVAGAAADLDEAIDRVDAASLALEEGRIADARSALDQAYALVSGVNGSLYGPAEIELAGALPIAGANLRAMRDGVALATRLIDGGRRILEAAAPLEGADGRLEVSLSDGTFPLEAIAASQRELRALVVQLPAGPPQLGRGVLSRLVDATDTLYAEAHRRRDQLGVLDGGLSLLTELAGGNGDRTYLVAIANTAEMRGSGGMILNYGVLEGSGGTIDLTAFGRIDELAFTGPVAVPQLPADYLVRWAGFDPLSRWRQANLAGDFTVVAPVLEAMYGAATGRAVDGVLQIDPAGLAGLLDGVGPVSVPELGQVSSDNVVALTLNEAYLRFPGVEQRTDVLGDVAEAALRRLVDGDIPSLRKLATGMMEAVDGRHLLVHTTARSPGEDLVALGADGALPPIEQVDSFHLTAQNLAGNKLDYYLDTALRVTGSIPDGALGALQAEVVLTNTATPGATGPAYIFGPGPTATPLTAGLLRSLVTLYVPFGTSLEGVSGAALVQPAVSGTEAGRPFVSFTVDVPAGESRTVGLVLQTAPRAADGYSFIVVPSPRVRSTTVSVDITTGAGAVAGDVELNRQWTFTAGAEPAQVEAPAFR